MAVFPIKAPGHPSKRFYALVTTIYYLIALIYITKASQYSTEADMMQMNYDDEAWAESENIANTWLSELSAKETLLKIGNFIANTDKESQWNYSAQK